VARAAAPLEKPADTKAPAADTPADVAARVARAKALVEEQRKRAEAEQAHRKNDRARDAVLVDKARQGDASAFRKLVEQHQSRLFSVAYGMLRDRDDAMDVVQDAFIKAHKKLAEFEGNAAFSTWLYRICVNLCIDRKRADARRKKVDADDALETVSDDSLFAEAEVGARLSGGNPLKNLSDRQLGGELKRALASLSEDHRSILLLREVEGMSYEEIAEALEIPRGTVMSRLFHARRNMQRLLRPYLGIADGIGLDGEPEDKAGEKSAEKGAEREPSHDASAAPLAGEDPARRRRPT
jgi:RNA polymerase sigma-70 factor, ECF subfamily